MTKLQQTYLLMLLHSSQDIQKLNIEFKHFGLSDEEIVTEVENIKSVFKNGIGNLNQKQFNNLLQVEQFNGNEIKKRLQFYEIAVEYHESITMFFQNYSQANKPINVEDLDIGFQGVQVASRDNFNTIINQGWTGDWDLNPDNVNIKRVQVASMNDDGQFPRGYYLNADIDKIEPIQYSDKIRYRIFISNPIVMNTGNRNVKFIAQPVRYIR